MRLAIWSCITCSHDHAKGSAIRLFTAFRTYRSVWTIEGEFRLGPSTLGNPSRLNRMSSGLRSE